MQSDWLAGACFQICHSFSQYRCGIACISVGCVCVCFCLFNKVFVVVNSHQQDFLTVWEFISPSVKSILLDKTVILLYSTVVYLFGMCPQFSSAMKNLSGVIVVAGEYTWELGLFIRTAVGFLSWYNFCVGVSWDCKCCMCVGVYLSLGAHVFYTIG